LIVIIDLFGKHQFIVPFFNEDLILFFGHFTMISNKLVSFFFVLCLYTKFTNNDKFNLHNKISFYFFSSLIV